MKFFWSSALFVFAAAVSVSAQDAVWPKLSELLFHGSWQPVSSLSSSEALAVAHLAASSVRSECRQTIEREGMTGIFRRLEVRQTQIQAHGPNVVLLEGSEDWEGDSENCFGDGMNTDMWILSFAGDQPRVFLDASAIALKIVEHKTRGYSDIVTARYQAPEMLELTQWKYDGARYVESRCAAIKISDEVLFQGSTDQIDRDSQVVEHPCQ